MNRILILITLVILSPLALAEGNPDAGKALAVPCVACHGETGNSLVPNFPNIAGQTEAYLYKQLVDIQSGDREILEMMGQLDNMSEQDLADISAYYAKQQRNFGAASADQVELGEAIYRYGIPRKNIAACTACHSPTGQGNGPAGFPALAGQWPDYTIAQLKAFQAGKRHNDGDSQMMRATARDMNEKEMKAVAAYLYGLQ